MALTAYDIAVDASAAELAEEALARAKSSSRELGAFYTAVFAALPAADKALRQRLIDAATEVYAQAGGLTDKQRGFLQNDPQPKEPPLKAPTPSRNTLGPCESAETSLSPSDAVNNATQPTAGPYSPELVAAPCEPPLTPIALPKAPASTDGNPTPQPPAPTATPESPDVFVVASLALTALAVRGVGSIHERAARATERLGRLGFAVRFDLRDARASACWEGLKPEHPSMLTALIDEIARCLSA